MEIFFYDENYTDSFTNGYSSVELEIVYHIGKRNYDPESYYEWDQALNRHNQTQKIPRAVLYKREFNEWVGGMVRNKTVIHEIEGTTIISQTVSRER